MPTGRDSGTRSRSGPRDAESVGPIWACTSALTSYKGCASKVGEQRGASLRCIFLFFFSP